VEVRGFAHLCYRDNGVRCEGQSIGLVYVVHYYIVFGEHCAVDIRER